MTYPDQSTTLRWGPKSQRVKDLEAWREHIRQHIIWIDEHRADLPIYKGIRKVYLREFLRVSVELQKRRLAEKSSRENTRKAKVLGTRENLPKPDIASTDSGRIQQAA